MRIGYWTSIGARIVSVFIVTWLAASAVCAQELGGAGTVQGTVKDPTGGVMHAVAVEISNPVSGLRRTATTDAAGKFVFRNLPPNPYHLVVAAKAFRSSSATSMSAAACRSSST